MCRSRYARVPFEFACCLLFGVPKASQPRSRGLLSRTTARREGILDEILYNAPRSEGGFVPEALYEEQVADEPKRLQVAETR